MAFTQEKDMALHAYPKKKPKKTKEAAPMKGGFGSKPTYKDLKEALKKKVS